MIAESETIDADETAAADETTAAYELSAVLAMKPVKPYPNLFLVYLICNSYSLARKEIFLTQCQPLGLVWIFRTANAG
jgi:hypothetical protein